MTDSLASSPEPRVPQSNTESIRGLMAHAMEPTPITRKAPNPLYSASPERLEAYRRYVASVAVARRAALS